MRHNTSRTFTILIILGATFIIPVSFLLWNESYYFDRVPFLSPIEYTGALPIRNDWRGKGDFGARRSGNRRHEGIDILAPLGTPVRAAKGGIAFSQSNKGMGNFVKIQHKNNMVTVYGHLSKTYIKPIQRVRQGQLIGEVGKSGNAKYNGIKPHLHFEVRINGIPVDPKKYIKQ